MTDWLPVETTVKPVNDPALMAQVKDWLKLDTSDSDATLISLIKAATQYIENTHSLRLFTQTVAIRRSEFCSPMSLPIGPVQSITSVAYLDSDGASQTLDTDYYAAPLVGLRPKISLAYGQSWPTIYDSPAAVTVTAVVGFGGINDQPEDIRLALLMLCSQWFDNRSGVSDKTMSEVPNAVRALLSPYYMPSLG